MLKNYWILCKDKTQRSVEGQVFTHEGVRFFWFVEFGVVTICEVNSGAQVTFFHVGTWSPNEYTKAAKQSIDRLMARLGRELVLGRLAEAKQLGTNVVLCTVRA